MSCKFHSTTTALFVPSALVLVGGRGHSRQRAALVTGGRSAILFKGSSEEFVGGFGCHRNQQDLRSGSTEGFRPSRAYALASPLYGRAKG